jgi:hypothetical protein
MNNKKKYMIFTADGNKPESTIGAIKTDDGVQFICEGSPKEILPMFAALYGLIKKHSKIPGVIFDKMMSNVESIDDFEERMKNESQD